MNRREALAATAAILGTTIIGSQVFLSGCTPTESKISDFNTDVLSLLDQVGETILPETPSSPGAGSCKIGEFMKTIVSECYSPDDRNIFFEGISTLQQTAQKRFSNPFNSLTNQQKLELMLSFDIEARNHSKSKEENAPEHFFTMLNQLTVWGFFSSEPGATKALRYVPVPGRYDGCVPYNKGEGAWIY